MKKGKGRYFLPALLLAAMTAAAVPVQAAETPAGEPAAASTGQQAAMASPETTGYRLPVFETSDIHGYIVDNSGEDCEYRLAYIADKVDDARKSDSYNDGMPRTDTVILLDAGDIYQGNTVSNLLEGEPLSQAFDIMQYDAVTIGNHEFDWGIENVVDTDATMMDYMDGDEMVANQIPVVLSNLYRDGKRAELSRDYVVLEKTAVNSQGEEIPVRVGVIGFAFDYSTSILRSMFADEGYEIREDYDQLEHLAAQLRTDGECDAVILLTHSEARLVAENLPEDSAIDLVLGGHLHSNDCGRTDSGLAYAQPAGQAGAYVYAELVFDSAASGAPVLRNTAGLQTRSVLKKRRKLYASEENSDELAPEVTAISDDALAQLEEVFGETLGYITVSARRQVFDPQSGDRSSTGGNWHASLMARAVDAQIGFFNLYGMREDLVIPPGAHSREVTVADVLTMFPFGNRICCFELTGEELLSVFEYAMTEAGATLFSVMTGIDCYFTEAGVNALVLDSEVLYQDGKWYGGHENDHFLVATNEFVSTTDREENGLHNPLCGWMETDRLVSSTITDAEGALKVLRAEGREHDGLLWIDTQPHFIYGEYTPAAYHAAAEDNSPSEPEPATQGPVFAEPTQPVEPFSPSSTKRIPAFLESLKKVLECYCSWFIKHLT